MKKIDERDTMFARMAYDRGTEEYEDYYRRNPHKLQIDSEIRELPPMGGEGSAMYNPITSPIVDATFRFLGKIKKYSEGEVNSNKKKIDDIKKMTKIIKGLAKHYNGKLVGITKLKDEHYYSHRGREPENYGEEIKNKHKYGIVFAVEMEKDMIFRGPQLSESIEVTKGYVDGAIIGMILSHYIRELGYEARNHMDGNYLVIAPLVARDAGLGQIGRHGLLITKEYGARVRLGVVTTDLELIEDPKDDFGLIEFCKVCGRCSSTCPGRSIPKGPMEMIDGIERWKINAEECYRRWRALGTDCGICLANCPFSDNIPGNLVNNLKEDWAKKEVLKNFTEKYPIRPYIRGNADWLE
ncbi:MAG: 4Fe-4S dicluster domain-containing protein [Anaeromicrobium sp.]|uniref:4Fe-4S dicluster domain-containing protein n=1 Tax=Anaeromicrobium sp. TaxID=1929132 RepID=UPI0025F51B66|nr:reductive dehalogenase domain-containing protein [Anaeromicrobium sp.]MCT4596087.1 4Fe-4S dicluster domain-containing protein [Anaeromicrobium sp.]